MHYGQTAFSKDNKKRTITTKDPNWQLKIGRQPTLSFLDIKLVNHIYGCGAHCGGKTCPGEGFLNKSCKCMCKSNYRTNPVKECSGSGGGGVLHPVTKAPTKAPTTRPPRPATTRRPTPGCKDSNWQCSGMGKRGACENNSWAQRNCKKTCNTC